MSNFLLLCSLVFQDKNTEKPIRRRWRRKDGIRDRGIESRERKTAEKTAQIDL